MLVPDNVEKVVVVYISPEMKIRIIFVELKNYLFDFKYPILLNMSMPLLIML